MATTTNYGWTTPDDTALVKDGAAAIRSLGSSIDTTTKNLNPGTTNGDIDYYATGTTKSRVAIGSSGQCLTVVAGVPSWAASPTSVLTTTGDLLYASAANTLARRAIGSTGDVLTVSGGLPTWAPPAAGGMTLISTTTLNGTPTITLSSIPQTYNNLYLVFRQFIPASDGARLEFRFNADSTANRHREVDTSNSTSGGGFVAAFNNPQGTALGATDNAAGSNQGFGIVEIFDYTNTSTWKMARVFSMAPDQTTPTSFALKMGMVGYNQTGAITSLSFFPHTGNMTSGTVLLYGVK